jgi:hypothetical protein
MLLGGRGHGVATVGPNKGFEVGKPMRRWVVVVAVLTLSPVPCC